MSAILMKVAVVACVMGLVIPAKLDRTRTRGFGQSFHNNRPHGGQSFHNSRPHGGQGIHNNRPHGGSFPGPGSFPGAGGVFPGAGHGVSGGVSRCRYWCRDPQGHAYCCEDNSRPAGPVGTKPTGRCPPVRPDCPPVRAFGPPETCSNDLSCYGGDKCCYDTCLKQHICKPPEYY